MITGTFKTYAELRAYVDGNIDQRIDDFFKKIAETDVNINSYNPIDKSFLFFLKENMVYNRTLPIKYVEPTSIDFHGDERIYCNTCGFVVHPDTKYEYGVSWSYAQILNKEHLTPEKDKINNISGTTNILAFYDSVSGTLYCPKCRTQSFLSRVADSLN